MTPTDLERELHIEDSAHQWRMAYERFQMHGNPRQGRSPAAPAPHERAILGRSAAVQAQRHQAFELRLAEGIDYFATAGALDRCMLERRAA